MPKAQINGIELYYEMHGHGGISRSSTRSICDVAGSILAARRQLLDNEITTYRLEIPGVSIYPLENLDNHIHPSPSSLTTGQSIKGSTGTGEFLCSQDDHSAPLVTYLT